MKPAALPNWPACMGAELAAAYLGISETKFLADVDAGSKPKPIRDGGRVLWVRADLDAWIREQQGLDFKQDPFSDAWDAGGEA